MSTEYFGRKSRASFHLNGDGSQFYLRVLDLLGEDVRQTGFYIKAATCRSWAKALRAAIQGKWIRIALLVGVERPVITGRTARPGSLTEALERLDEHFNAGRTSEPTKTRDLDAANIAEVLNFADFLDQAGGCYRG